MRIAIVAIAVLLALTGGAAAQIGPHSQAQPLGPTGGDGTIVGSYTPSMNIASNHLIGAFQGKIVDTGVLWTNIPTGLVFKYPYRQATAALDLISFSNDYFICAANWTAAADEFLPFVPTQSAVPMAGVGYTIKDCSGTAASHPITVYGNGNAIDGQGFVVMQTAFQSMTVIYTDTGNANRGNGWMTTNGFTSQGGLVTCSNRLDFSTGCNSAYRGALL